MQKPNNKLVWTFLVGGLLSLFFPSGINDVTKMIYYGLVVALLVIIELDYRKVMKWYKENSGAEKKPFGDLWILIFPAYLFKRNKLVGEKQTTFYVSIAFLIGGFILETLIFAAVFAGA